MHPGRIKVLLIFNIHCISFQEEKFEKNLNHAKLWFTSKNVTCLLRIFSLWYQHNYITQTFVTVPPKNISMNLSIHSQYYVNENETMRDRHTFKGFVLLCNWVQLAFSWCNFENIIIILFFFFSKSFLVLFICEKLMASTLENINGGVALLIHLDSFTLAVSSPSW